jgi:hypothetical protein
MKRFLLTVALMLAAGRALALGNFADVTLYDRAEQRNLPVYWHEGRAYVVGKPGNEYQITVRNRAGQDVLAVVSVDGVNVVSGETASASQSGYVIDTWRAMDIKGWRKSLARTAAFYFTELPDSYAARTGRPDNVGVIGVALFRRKMEEPPMASNSPFILKDRAESAAGSVQSAPRAEEKREKSLGTGHGRGETSQARYVGFERATAAPEEVITLYYDSYANLAARGIIRPEYSRNEPQPFPLRFVPDPPSRW